jgi:hypothetical protein
MAKPIEFASLARPQSGSGIPDFLRDVINDEPPASKRAVAEKSVLDLNDSMQSLYEVTLHKYQRNMRENVPIILALFTGAGGQMILYRPGHEAEVAPPVPIVYQLAKSIGHSSMAIYQIVIPYVSDPKANQMWRGPLLAYFAQNQLALDNLKDLGLSADDELVLGSILDRNLTFMEACLTNSSYTYDDLEQFIRSCTPFAVKTIAIASTAQVGHWMKVVETWKNELGPLWDRTYGVSNTLYVARQNNLLFSVLVQFMGQETMGDRLLLIETPQFETTPEMMLELLARIVSDRALGMVFFKNYFLMDVELLGGGGRKVIEQEMQKRGLKPLLPPLVPFRSNDWPWKTDPTKGQGPASLDEIKL